MAKKPIAKEESTTKAKKKAPAKAKSEEVRPFLTLPTNAKVGGALTVVYSEQRTKELGLTPEEFNYGAYHGFIQKVDGSKLYMLFVYPEGEPPEEEVIDLATGVDDEYRVAVSELKACPIPNAVLKKWQKAGEAAEEAAEEEEEEDEDVEEAEGVDYM